MSCDNLAQKCPLLREDELVLLGEIEIGHAFGVATQPRTIGLIGGETLEGDQRERDVVGALVRHPVADEIAAAFRDDAEPAFRIFLELRALERIELVADEHGDGHGNLLQIFHRHCEPTGSRECAPDDRLREAIRKAAT